MSDGFDLTALIREVTGDRPVIDATAVTREVLRRIPGHRYPTALAQAVRLVIDPSARHTPPAAPVPPAPASAAAGSTEPAPATASTPTASAPPPAPPSPGPPAPSLPSRQQNPTRPAARSWKVAGVRDQWQAALDQQISTGDGAKRLGDCTRDDLKLAADVRDDAADTHRRHARRFRRLAELLTEHNVEFVHQLPPDAVTETSADREGNGQ